MKQEVLTIGHSNHAMADFLRLLHAAGVTALADVRSVPHSRHAPQFNHAALQIALRGAGIAHVYLGSELGGRPRDQTLYRDGIADYEKIAATGTFQAGLRRVLNGAATHRVVLMCAERYPLNCHRCLLIGRALAAGGTGVRHILPDGSMLAHAAIEAALLRHAGRGGTDLFMTPEERLAAAWRDLRRKPGIGPAIMDSVRQAIVRHHGYREQDDTA